MFHGKARHLADLLITTKANLVQTMGCSFKMETIERQNINNKVLKFQRKHRHYIIFDIELKSFNLNEIKHRKSIIKQSASKYHKMVQQLKQLVF